MPNKKVAFSIIELVLVMTFISVIVIYELHILEGRKNQYVAPYYNAYNTLTKVTYNILADIYCPDQTSKDEDCKKGPRKFPTTSKDLCKRYLEYLNIPDDKNVTCDAELTDDTASNICSDDCSHTLMFKTSNSNKFYISRKYNIKVKDELGQYKDVDYFIVYIDINGEKKPNKVYKEENKDIYPDIVPFAVTTRGEVIPLGYPTYSYMYLSAKVRYSDTFEGNSTQAKERKETEKYSESLTFANAVNKAWGNVADYDIPFTYYKNMNDELKAAGNLAASFWNMPSNDKLTPIDSDNHCQENTYNCTVKIDSNNNARI